MFHCNILQLLLSSPRGYFGYSSVLTNLWASFPPYSWTTQLVLNVAQREQNREILCPFCAIVALLSIWRERNNGLMISVCLPNRLPSWLIGWIHWVTNVNWPLLKVSKLTFRALALRLSLWRKAHVPNVSFETLNGSQFTLLTKLVLPNYPVILPHRLNSKIFLEVTPLIHFPSW